MVVHGEGLHCEWGLVSRQGWALVDDSANYALSDESDFWDGPNVDAVDLYFFGHGHDYKGALKDFVAVGIIYEIDNIVAKTLFGSETKEMLEVDKKKIVVTKEAD